MTTSDHSTAGRRVALVTGASGGIGRAVAERLGVDGMAVGVHSAGNKNRAQETADAVVAAGGSAVVVGGDVADEDAMRKAFDTLETAHGGVDVVVNTAGVMLLSPLADLDLADLDRMHRTNVRGTFVVGREAARRVRAGGAIVNFSTSVRRLNQPNYSAYAASKGAVEALTPILAKEMRGRDVTVNAIAPGPTATALFLDGKPQDLVDQMAKMAPLERLGQPEDQRRGRRLPRRPRSLGQRPGPLRERGSRLIGSARLRSTRIPPSPSQGET